MSDVFAAAQDLPVDAEPSTQPEQKMRVFKPENLPMGRIMAAVMRSAALVQGQEQAKETANEQASSMGKFSVTLKPSQNGGPPLVTVKDAPADLLNGTQQQDVADAYTTPRDQVEKKISATGLDQQQATQPEAPSAPSLPSTRAEMEQIIGEIEATRGYHVPRPWDPDIAEKVKSEDGLWQLGQEFGFTREHARQAWKQIKSGKVSPDTVARRMADFRAKRIAAMYKELDDTVSPLETRRYRQGLEADRVTDNTRQQQQLADAERNKVVSLKQAIIEKRDWSLVPESELRDAVEEQNTSGVPFSDREFRAVLRKRAEDIDTRFQDFVSNPERFRLGDFNSWEQAKVAFGHKLTPAQDAQGRASWQAARTYVTRLAAREARDARSDNTRYDRLIQQLSGASADKPTAVGRDDVRMMSGDELLSIDPSTVKAYDTLLRQKSDMLAAEDAKLADEIGKANAKAAAIRKKGYVAGGDAEELAGLDYDIAAAKRRRAAIAADRAKVMAKQAERRQGAPQQPHARVANAQYAPEVERAIAAYMKAEGLGRAKAIEALRAAGRLR